MFDTHSSIISHTLANADAPHVRQHDFLSAGTEVTFLDTGVIKFEPNTACDTSLVISCAVHGNETAPIEIISRIIDDLLAEEQKCGQRILFILANPWSMVAAERFVDLNMNRLFCGQWQHQDLTLKEVKRAAKLEAYVANFYAEEPVTVTQRFHYDCHTAIKDSARARFALYPFVADRKIPDSQKAFLDQADIQTLLLQQSAGNTFSSFSSSTQQAQSFTLELGKVKPFGENDLSQFSGIDGALRKLISGDALPNRPARPVDSFSVCHEIERTSEQWQFLVPDESANFAEFVPGQLIWQDGVHEYRVGDEPEYLVFPNGQVPIGQRAGLMLRKLS
ncbi:MAG: succinylglutamate desuccinylase [Reinekea sp.]|jgi:succinylglutamate desuccinylase